MSSKYYYWEYGQTAAAIFIFTMIVVGNISILNKLKSCSRRRSNVNYFIVQLAIADLLVGLFSVSLDTVLRLQKSFTYGLMACRISKYIQVLFIYSSTYLLVALSIDRWEAVVKPLAFTRNRSHGHYLATGAWFLAFISATPVTLSVTIKEIEGLPQCWISYDVLGWKIYMVYLTSSLLVIPALVIAVCYTHIVYTIWRKGKLVAQQKQVRNCSERLSHRKKQQQQHENSNSGNTIHEDISSSFNQLKLAKCQLEAPAAEHIENQRMQVGPAIVLANKEEEYDIITEDGYVSSDEEYVEEREEYDEEEEVGEYDIQEEGKLEVEEDGSSGKQGRQTKRNSPNSNLASADPSHNNVLFEMSEINTAESNTSMRKKCCRQITTLSSNSNTTTITIAGGANRNYTAQQHGSGVIPKARIKTIKMTLVIVAAFVLCWSPFCIINLCSVFGLIKNNTNWTIALMTLSQSLAHLNSAVNPIIFWLFSSKRSSSTSAPSSDARVANRSGERVDLIKNTHQNCCHPLEQILCGRICCLKDKFITSDPKMFESTRTSAISTTFVLPSN